MAMNRATATAAALLLAALLTGCAPAAPDAGPGAGSSGTPSTDDSPSPEESSSAKPSAKPSPKPTSTAKAVVLPKDCRKILSDDVLAQLKDVPLNDKAFGASGVGDDGSLTCIWADPKADTTKLVTTIKTMRRGPALDMLNKLVAEEGFSCFTPDGGTRCEKTWANKEYPVTDGRTLFWRDSILIDTKYSNLAPTGYTSSIVEKLFD